MFSFSLLPFPSALLLLLSYAYSLLISFIWTEFVIFNKNIPSEYSFHFEISVILYLPVIVISNNLAVHIISSLFNVIYLFSTYEYLKIFLLFPVFLKFHYNIFKWLYFILIFFKFTQMCIMDFWTQREGEGGMIWENDILTCILSCKNWIASQCLMQDTACLELVHGDDPERCYGEAGGRGVHVWERM